MNVRYNIYFNGNESFKQGIVKINQAHVDDYSEILLMYPISYHPNASIATADMERTIDKSKKAIKTRSIRKKPKKNPNKLKDPAYRAFLNQEEFNPMIVRCWLLMGKAQFYKADFLAAVGSFTYILHHFPEKKEIISETHLWLARSYAEMGWYYEAEDVLTKINKDDFSEDQSALFAAVNADLLLKQKQYNEAIPFLKIAIDGEDDTKEKARFEYILGQIYQQKGENENAFQMYKAVIKTTPPYQLAFNARIKEAETYVGSNKDVMLKMLKKMSRDSKNTDYLDQIYCAIGKIYKQQGNTQKAIDNYKLSIKSSTRNSYEKAQAYILLADLYYEQENYIDAGPNYVEAVALMNPQSNDYRRVNNLARTLSELNKNISIVHLQDSLQILSNLPEKEKMERIRKIIAKVIADEAAAKKKEQEEKEKAESSFGSKNNNAGASGLPLGPGNKAAFYFYNTQLLESGKNDFQRKWGSRKLEDNWRRQIKTPVVNDSTAESDSTDEKKLDGKTPKVKKTKEELLAENKKPDFYLKQLFTTPEQFVKSDKAIASALYNIGVLYNDKIGNTPMAVKTFEELERRFPTSPKLPDAYFYVYQTYLKKGDKEKAEEYRMKLINKFSDSKYAKILSQPDYEQKLRTMAVVQDSLYTQTYDAYLQSNYQKVFENYTYVDKNYPTSGLMPKFMLLNSLAKAKTESSEQLKVSLEDLLKKYPESDVAPMAKDLLALMAQGKESQKGNNSGGLQALREKETGKQAGENNIDLSRKFTNDTKEKYIFVLSVPKGSLDVKKLQYNIAAYNFTKFLIKDFDLALKEYDKNTDFVLIKNLENLDEALWYQSGVLSDKYLSEQIQNNGISYFVISESNYDLIFTPFNVTDYQSYFNTNIAKDKSQQIIIPKPKQLEQPVQKQDAPIVTVAVTKGKEIKQDNQTVVEKNATPALAQAVSAKTEPVKPQAQTLPDSVAQKTDKKPAEVTPTAPAAAPVVAEPKKNLPKYRGLYTYDVNAKHYLALYIVKGEIDFPALKDALDKYNTENYPLLNMQVVLQPFGKQNVVLVGMLPDAVSAKSYLLRLVKDRSLFVPMKQAEFRNIVITKDNLEVLKKIGNANVYLDFLKEMYLK
jgi:tetratricopeptide (TPR) repeat protein